VGRTPGPTSITVRLVDADGGPDVEVRFDPAADLTAASLVEAWPGALDSLVVDGRAVPEDRPLVECGLADGAVVSRGPPTPRSPELVVVAGPLAPTAVAVADPTVVGSGSACDLRLDHPSVAGAHATVEQSRSGWTVCALDGPVLLDGHPLRGPELLRPGAVVSLGAVDLQLLDDVPPRLVPPPRAPVHRAARLPVAAVPDPGPPPDAPSPSPAPVPPGLLTLGGPVVVGVVLALAVHPTAGLISLGMPVIALGSFLDARRRHRREGRRADADHATALARHREATAAAERAVAAQRRNDVPTVVDALHRARSGIGLWPDRRCAEVAVGWCDDGVRAPVTTDTTGLGIAGPPHWAAAVARAVAVQLAARCGPRDRPEPALEVAERHEGLSDRCAAVLTWSPDGGRLADRTDGRRDVAVRPFLASAGHAEAFEHAVARWTDPDGSGTLPDEVGLGELELCGVEDGRRTLAAALGKDADGRVVVDLVADGPHALVAGTTGAGKSELLRTWVVALAARHPPSALAFVLVDYKGGSAFDAVRRLPHVAGLVTDLDPGLGERLLVALRAEVRDREAHLRAAGAADLRDLPGGPPRLVVVVDEFATLAAELPDVLGALVDVARRGRSLGVHLVLATQRPAGAVNDDIRANTSLRLCLRTLDPADSQDVLGTATAATLPPDRPGRAWLRRGGAPQLVQIATGRRPAGDGRPALEVRRVDRAWPEPEGPTELDMVVAAHAHRPAVAPIWLPPLPDHLAVEPGDDPGAVVLGQVDRPADRRQPALVWRPADGHLVVVGGRRSGRTSALATAIGADLAPLAGLPHVGAVLTHHDRDQVRRLVGRLTATGPTAELTLLVVDGIDTLAALLDDLDGARLLESIDRLVRSDVRVAVTSARAARLPPALLGTSVTTVVLRLDDPADAALARWTGTRCSSWRPPSPTSRRPWPRSRPSPPPVMVRRRSAPCRPGSTAATSTRSKDWSPWACGTVTS